jgi:hypothetical protein
MQVNGSQQANQPVRHLCQKQLAKRWSFSPRTLERWRTRGKGPRYLKLNGRCLYRIEDVLAFEQERLRDSTASSELGS